MFGMTILHAALWQIGIVSFGSTRASKSAEGFLEKTPPADTLDSMPPFVTQWHR